MRFHRRLRSQKEDENNENSDTIGSPQPAQPATQTIPTKYSVRRFLTSAAAGYSLMYHSLRIARAQIAADLQRVAEDEVAPIHPAQGAAALVVQ